MSNRYDFYGDLEDIVGVWKFVAELPDMRLIEAFSRRDSENRWFEQFPEDEFRQGSSLSLVAWPTSAGGAPRQRIDRLSEISAARLRDSGKSVLESPAFIKISTAPSPNSTYISPRELKYWTEKSARRYGGVDFAPTHADDVDWRQLKQVTDQIISHIKQAAPARWNSKPVLPGCADSLKQGSQKLWYWGQTGTVF